MGLSGLGAGILLSATFHRVTPIIQAAQAERTRAAVLRVVPDTRHLREFALPGTERAFACTDDQGRPAGTALEARGRGFQEDIRILYGIDRAGSRVTGLVILESRETPGLGDKIETDWFRGRFIGLDAGARVAHLAGRAGALFEAVKPGRKTKAYEVEGISGATISSRAVVRTLSESAARALPALEVAP